MHLQWSSIFTATLLVGSLSSFPILALPTGGEAKSPSVTRESAWPEQLYVRDSATGAVVDIPAFITAIFNGLANTILATGDAAANTIAATGGAVANGLGQPDSNAFPAAPAEKNSTVAARELGDMVNKITAEELKRQATATLPENQ